MDRKKILWALLSLVIAGLSIWAVIAQSARFSPEEFWQFIVQADNRWLAGAMICMFGFIWFEGQAVVRIAGSLGYRCSTVRGTVYGAADIYFSAITPSASGGQPASAYFMMSDGIPGPVTTVVLLTNVIMYTLALLVLGLITTAFRFDIILRMSWLSRILIIIGAVVLIFMAVIFYLLLRREKALHRICDRFLRFLSRIHLLRHEDRKRQKLNSAMEEYRECSREISGKKAMLAEALFWNIMQRIAQFGTAFCVFMARGEGIRRAVDVFFTQCLVSMGSNCVPIPGSMGVADYLMLDGYTNIIGKEMAANMELLCRAISFYGCTLLGLLIVIVAFCAQKIGRKNVRLF